MESLPFSNFTNNSLCLQGYFAFWVVLAAIWTIVATVVATLLPLVEARRILLRIISNMLGLQVGTSTDARVEPVKQAPDYCADPTEQKFNVANSQLHHTSNDVI